jgi:hypothetical protein
MPFLSCLTMTRDADGHALGLQIIGFSSAENQARCLILSAEWAK